MLHPEVERINELLRKCFHVETYRRPLKPDSEEFKFLVQAEGWPQPQLIESEISNVISGRTPCTLGQFYSLNIQYTFLANIKRALSESNNFIDIYGPFYLPSGFQKRFDTIGRLGE